MGHCSTGRPAWAALVALCAVRTSLAQAPAAEPDTPAIERREAAPSSEASDAEAASGVEALSPPRLVDYVEAAYPAAALAAGVSGIVRLRLTINVDGVVSEVEVLEAPSADLGAAAVAAGRAFRFEPARRGGTPVASRIVYEYEFRLPPAAGSIEGEILVAGPPGAVGAPRRPASGASVIARGEDGSEHVTQADADGRYRFEGLPPGSYRVGATLLGAGSARGVAPVVSGQTTRGALVIEARAAASGVEPAGGAAAAADALVVPTPSADPAADSGAIVVTVQGKSTADRMRESAEAVKVIETEQARRESADLAEVLARTPGVGVRRSGGLGSGMSLSLNGFSQEQVRFFLDGVPLDYAGYPFGLANVPVNLIERVEIHAGVVPVRFGADALGGAVNLVSDRRQLGTHAGASYQAGSYGEQRATASARHVDSEGGWMAAANAFFDRADNDYPVDVEVPDELGQPSPERVERFHDGYEAIGGGLELGVQGRSWARRFSVRGFGSRFERELQSNAVMSVPYGGVTYGETSGGGHLRYTHDLGEAVTLDATVGYAYVEGQYQDVSDCVYDWFGDCIRQRAEAGERGDDSDRLSFEHAVYARLRLRVSLAPEHHVTLAVAPTFVTRSADERRQPEGVTRDVYDLQRDLFTWINGLEYEAESPGGGLQNIAFVKHYFQAARSEEPAAGFITLRRDRDTQRLGAGDGLRYRFLPWLLAKASYEWATRLPDAEEVFGNNALIGPNLELSPEASHNVNLGAAIDARGTAAGDFRLGLTGYLREAEQLIRLLGSEEAQSYQNVQSARSLGVEASAGWTSPRELVTIDASLTEESFRNTSSGGAYDSFRGDRMPNRPYRFGNVSVQLKQRGLAASDALSLGAHLRYVHDFFPGWESLGARQFKRVVPSQLVASAVLGYATAAFGSTLTTSVEVQNLTDAHVEDFWGAQRPGRTFHAKATIAH
jgi:vitamin B12 transporter